jgi:hypothetical protein
MLNDLRRRPLPNKRFLLGRVPCIGQAYPTPPVSRAEDGGDTPAVFDRRLVYPPNARPHQAEGRNRLRERFRRGRPTN